jgi:eukaryotic-like serine/threonine-protein kinase
VASEPVFGDGMFSVSGNGVLVFRTGGIGGSTELESFDRSGKKVGSVGPSGDYLNPELSPDGRRVAAERRSAHGDLDIYLLELSGGTARRFTFNPADDYFPVWSPDGSHVVFASSRNGSYGLYQKPSSRPGNEEPLLTNAASDVAPYRLTAAGGLLVYRMVNAKGFNDVWAFPLLGDRKPFPVLHSEEFSQSFPDLSPDGGWVAYSSNETGRYEVYIQRFPKAGAKSQVSTSGGVYPRWSHDGRELFYLSPDETLMSVVVKAGSPSESDPPRRLFKPRMLGGSRIMQGFRQQYDVASDGHFLINVPVTEESILPITVVLNWTAGLNR